MRLSFGQNSFTSRNGTPTDQGLGFTDENGIFSADIQNQLDKAHKAQKRRDALDLSARILQRSQDAVRSALDLIH